jgi:hypothetical protein
MYLLVWVDKRSVHHQMTFHDIQEARLMAARITRRTVTDPNGDRVGPVLIYQLEETIYE